MGPQVARAPRGEERALAGFWTTPASVQLAATLVWVLFGGVAFGSAALVFLSEPMLSKRLLPILGGSATIWIVVSLFFQIMMLAGYALAHFGVTWLGLRRAACVQVALGFLGLALLPQAPEVIACDWIAPSWRPLAAVFLTLATQYAPALICLASVSPSLQYWHAHLTGKPPYRLYSIGNAGCLVALLIYPLAVEPWFALSLQTGAWRMAFAVCLGGLAACALIASAKASVPKTSEAAQGGEAAPTWRRRSAWIGLSALPASLLMGVTQHLTINVAPIPLLWTIPLAIYLSAFIAAFANPLRCMSHGRVLMFLTMPLLAVAALGPGIENLTWLSIAVNLVGFAGCTLACLGRLATRRPESRYLTEFYLWTSVGGVAGGCFNSLLAPVLFDRMVEYKLALAVACVLVGPAFAGALSPRWRRLQAVPAACLLLLTGAVVLERNIGGEWLWAGSPLLAMVALAAANSTRRPFFAAAAIAGLALPAFFVVPGAGRPAATVRSVFGPIAVVDIGQRRILVHGNTIHGEESLDSNHRTELKGYYAATSGIARLIGLMKDGHAAAVPMKGLVVGLGAGEMACMGGPSLDLSFAEIDALMIRVANEQFGFLAACGRPDVQLADGRVAVRGAEPGSLDFLGMDAFSSDAIPAHLITSEAFGEYAAKLKTGGAIAVNVSNRYVALAPVVAEAARANGMRSFVLLSRTADGASEWVAATADAALGERLERDGWSVLRPDPRSLWHDDRWSLLPALRF